MVLKTISSGCGVRASLMLFFTTKIPLEKLLRTEFNDFLFCILLSENYVNLKFSEITN